MQQTPTFDHPLQRWQESLWLLIALLTPLFVNLWVEQQFEASKVWLLRTLVWMLLMVWLLGCLHGHRTKPLPNSIRNIVIALVLVLLLSTLLSSNRYIAIYGTLDRAGGFLTQLCYMLLFVCVATRIDAQGSRRLLHIITLTAVPICLLGLAQFIGWQPLPIFTDARSPMTTTLGRANFTGAYLALLLPLTLTAAVTATSRLRSAVFWTLIVLELAVIALTEARAAWIAALVGMGVLWWLRLAPHWSPQIRWTSALSGGLAFGLALGILLQLGIANEGSIAARWTIWQASLRLLWPRLWLGYGADTLELHFPSVYPPQLVYYQGRGVIVDRAHNWLLDWSLNYGIVATVLLIGLVFVIVRRGWQQLTTPQNYAISSPGERPLEYRWLAACIASVCAQLVGNLFLFEVAATAVLFWLLLAILTATTGAERSIAPPAMPLWAGKMLIASSILIVGWVVWQSTVRPLQADLHSWRGTQALGRRNDAVALAEYTRAVERQPRRTAYHVAVALTADQLGNHRQAIDAMQEALVLRPTDPVLYMQLAAIYAGQVDDDLQQLEMAFDAYNRAITLAPTLALTYRNYADLALRTGYSMLAIRLAQKAVNLDATDGVAYGILGWAQYNNDSLTAAGDAFEQAVKWQPDSADFHLGLATVLFRQGDMDGARHALEQSLEIDPVYAPSLTLAVQLQRQP